MRRLLPLLLVLLSWAEGRAQSAQVRVAGFNGDRFPARVGQLVTLEIFADLQGVTASGFSLYVTIPNGPFQVVDADPNRVGTQPFVAGPLFQGAGENRNILYSENESPANQIEGLQLQYAAVFGQGQNRQRTGSGILATFKVRCIKPVLNGRFLVDDNPVLETFLTLPDGLTTARFRTLQGIEVTVTGITLNDIPDVVLLPDQADSTTIGSLDNYLGNIISPVDSIRWTFDPPSFDSLTIQVDPRTRVVKIIPARGWRGQRQIVWTATESQSLLPGEAPLSASDVSRIVVNNPPQFTPPSAVGGDGAKRDTVFMHEDLNAYVPGVLDNNRSRAFKALDLDTLTVDPDIIDPQTELNFTVLLYDNSDQPPIIGEDDDATHELLIWSRPDFAGVDSFKVVVRDLLRGEDSLRVIVVVEEVPDAPRFLLAGQTLRLTRGGSRAIALKDFVTDVDTPLENLTLEWDDDPAGHFIAQKNTAGDSLVFSGDSTFVGDGRFVFRAYNPIDPENLKTTLVFNISSIEALPPAVTSTDLRICLTPPGIFPALPDFAVDLDDLVEDPSFPDNQLRWEHPFPTKSVLEIDADHVLTVSEPLPAGFVGFEKTTLIATNPDGQTVFLNLRIYSSDRSPVAGGLPDLQLQRGEIHNSIDLDEYYCDCNNLDEEMRWEVDVGGRKAFATNFSADDFQVSIDPLSHKITFAVGPTATFRIETLIFQVTSVPEGVSSQDTMKVTIGEEGGETTGGFQVKPLGSLEVLVREFFTLDLDDYVEVTPEVSKADIEWLLSSRNATHTVSSIDTAHVLSIFGLSSGTDTLTVAAQDKAGNQQILSTTVRVLGQNEALKLQAIPDIQFIANVPFQGVLRLNEFVVDRQAHPDSVLVWSATPVGTSPIIVQVVGGDSVYAVSTVVAEADWVFEVLDLVHNSVGRDTVRVFSLDPATASRPLKDLPPITFATTQEDSSLFLDNFLPEGISRARVRWSVSGQSITSPFIDPRAPHELHLKAVGNKVGIDTLRFVADLGGGFTASGTMLVTVTEAVDSTTLHLELVPNPFNPEFIDVFIVARRALAGTPNVVRSFEGSDSTVAVRQIEEDLAKRGALIWTGSVRLRPQAAGIVFFSTQAKTVLGTALLDTASVAIAPVVAGKPVALEHGGVELWLPPGAAMGATSVALRTRGPAAEEGTAKLAGLVLRKRIDLYPAGLVLGEGGMLRVALAAGEGLYYYQGGGWVPAPQPIARLGRYAVLAGQAEDQEAAGTLPQHAWLGANYPNPFNPETLIPFALGQEGRVRVGIYNLAGQRLRLLVDEVRPPGQYQVRWDGRTQEGDQAGSGVYLYRLEVGDQAFSRRMSLLK